MLSEVPEGWDKARIDAVLQRNTTSVSVTELAAEGLVAHYSLPAFDANKKPVIESGSEIKSNKTAIDKDCLLFSKLNPRIPRVWRVRHFGEQKPVCSTEFWALKPKTDEVSLSYAEYFLGWNGFLSHPSIKPASSTNSHQRVDRKAFDAFMLPLPPLNEQRRIAEILSSVDASIQATQAVIEQAERVKRGLMEELLTGGLGSEAIERGEVPDGWQRTKQGSVATFFNGRAYKLKEWEKEGTPVIRLQNLTGSGKEYYYSTLELPPHQYCDFGDLLFMWSASFGAYIWQGGKAIYHYHIWKVEQDAAQMMRLFHYYLLQYYTDIWKQDAHGMAMLHLTKKGMEQLEITIPPLSQQEKIVQILSDADDFIAQQRANAEQKMKIKQGLMNELLTGKVRTV